MGGFLELTLLLIPSLMLFVLPFALLCSVIYVYYRLSMDSELPVLSGAGLSNLQLSRPALYVGAIVSLFSYFISLYLLPISYHQFKDMQVYMRDNYASLLLQEKVFNSPVEGLTVYIRERDQDGMLHGIIVHDNRDIKSPPMTMMAEQGKLIQSPQGPHFLMYNGNRQAVENGKLSFLSFDQYTLDIGFYSKAGKVRSKQPEELYINELLYPQTNNALDRARFIAEGHNRITWPLFPIALAAIASAILLTGEFNRRGNAKRIVMIIVIAGLAITASVGFLNLAVKNPWLITCMYANIIILSAVSYAKLRDKKYN